MDDLSICSILFAVIFGAMLIWWNRKDTDGLE